MRKKVIVEEFKQFPRPGVLVMKDRTNFMTGKMMNIEDEIRITYAYSKNTILNPDTLSTVNIDTIMNNLNNVSYDVYKQANVELTFNDTQSDFSKENNTEWILELDSRNLLREYLYNEMYTHNPDSPFKLIPADILDGNKVNEACYKYIDANVLSRYKMKEFILWAEYHKLSDNNVIGVTPEIKLLKQQPIFNTLAIPLSNPDSNKETVTLKEYADGVYDIHYKQTKSSQYYTFLYYFDVIYVRA